MDKKHDLEKQLADELKDMVDHAGKGNNNLSIHLFGIKNADIIVSNKLSKKEINKLAGLKPSFETEISAGVKLGLAGCKYVGPSAASSVVVTGGRNIIVYGTPGCGKSYYVENELLPKELGISTNNIIRTTFYEDYSNSDFVGQILPSIKGGIVDYKFVAGPMVRALLNALQNPDKATALIIEELNRGPAASIFGDFFQLLDRDINGESIYEIFNQNVIDYLNDKLSLVGTGKELLSIKIPANLYIIATMNTSDQNVFTLDTAFKRRWDFKKMSNKFESSHPYKDYLIPGNFSKDITWEELVNDVNDYLSSPAISSLLNAEDKQVGAYFVDSDLLDDPTKVASPRVIDKDKSKKFAFKFLEYLWDDVAKLNRSEWFDDSIHTLDQLIEKFIGTLGLDVFKHGIIK